MYDSPKQPVVCVHTQREAFTDLKRDPNDLCDAIFWAFGQSKDEIEKEIEQQQMEGRNGNWVSILGSGSAIANDSLDGWGLETVNGGGSVARPEKNNSSSGNDEVLRMLQAIQGKMEKMNEEIVTMKQTLNSKGL